MRDPSPDAFHRSPARLVTDLELSWQTVDNILDELARSSLSLRNTSTFSGTTLADVQEWYRDTSQQLLVEPVTQFLELRPVERTLEALQACDRELAPRSIRARKGIDAGFQRMLDQAALDLCEPWRIWRGGNHAAEWKTWEQHRVRRSREALTLLEKYKQWGSRSAASLSGSNGSGESDDDSKTGWWRQYHAAAAMLQMEVAVRELTLAWFDTSERVLDDVRRERLVIRSSADATLKWIEEGASAPIGAPAPISAEERLRNWAQSVEEAAAERLPEQIEILLLTVRPHWRSIPARARFLKSFQSYAHAPMRAILEQSWAAGARIVREVWQAKEIVDYWHSSPERSDETGELVAGARHNAIAILREQLQPDKDIEQLDSRAVEAFWIWYGKGLLDFEAGEFGWLTLLQRPRGRAVVDAAAERLQSRTKVSAQHAGQWTSGQVDKAIGLIGGKIPEQPTAEQVVRRTTLRDTLSLSVAKAPLPALYRLLFRLAPVEDRRFLLGRDHELAGIRQAAEDWESGRFAACLMIGARGSGKTSLLNCAVADVFAGKHTIRAEFDERVLTPDKLTAFLRVLLNVETDANLEAVFRAEHRIVILEESERIYLRTVGGFAAARHLMHLIQRTAPATLWIIVMNDKAFRVLDAAVDVHRVFSHRINAMNVSRVDLENAILERHRLSGLRLKFAPPPSRDPRVNRVRQWIGLEDSPQKLFFDSLFQQSEGIFRSAFELWLSSIQGVEGETLIIRQPLDPAFAPFRRELAREDHFTLLVIQEHGSLTQHEVTELMGEPSDVSGSRMERLTALGLIEPDPQHPGARVRPEAQRFVNDLLRRTNLT